MQHMPHNWWVSAWSFSPLLLSLSLTVPPPGHRDTFDFLISLPSVFLLAQVDLEFSGKSSAVHFMSFYQIPISPQREILPRWLLHSFIEHFSQVTTVGIIQSWWRWPHKGQVTAYIVWIWRDVAQLPCLLLICLTLLSFFCSVVTRTLKTWT